MKLIVGLGNPGRQYRLTRHNVGFWVVERLATACGAEWSQVSRLHSAVAKVTVAGSNLLLLKPDTFMNLSGQAVAAALHWYKIEESQMLVVHDDVSLPLGKLRYQKNGGAGGQHGIESIIEHLGGRKSFDRLKVGVGPDPGGERRADYVLSQPSESEQPLCKEMIELAARSLALWISTGTQSCMNEFNGMDLRAPEIIEAEKKQSARKKCALRSQGQSLEANVSPETGGASEAGKSDKSI